ncbi:hypothetical protein BH09BAC2_BH09BAC2_11690 [soil metagenome]
MMKKYALLLYCCLIFLTSAKVKSTSSEKINWQSLAETESNLMQQHKPVIIDLYTDWCHWCKVMDNTTYNNKKVADYLNEKYYAVKIDAETTDTLSWKGKKYMFNPQYRINMLALMLTNRQLSFPTTIIIPDNNSQPIAIAGYIKANELEPIVKYFGEGAYTTKSYADFKKTFRSSW